ncbi:flavodoxin [Shewanella gaetbuli]
MAEVSIVFGTVYGGAQFTAETLAKKLQEKGHHISLKQTAQLQDYVPSESEYLIIVCSTTGQGDLPDDIFPWFAKLKSQAPYLPKLQYSIVALGDSSYETFCAAGKQFDELLSELGAKALTPLLEIDASETMEPEVEAVTWIPTWLDAINKD